jgi:hypothetical protein
MSDLRDLLHEAAGPTPPPTSAWTADADLARAQRAFRRRRAGRVSAGSGLIAAVAASVIAIATNSLVTNSPRPPVAAPVAAASLVSYTGAQPRGYTLDKVPAGWKVVESDRGTLTLAPAIDKPGLTDERGVRSGEEPLEDKNYSLRGKIGIWLVADVPAGAMLHAVKVGDKTALVGLVKTVDGWDSDNAQTLFLRQPNGNHLAIQVWGGLGWSIADIAELAESIHVTKHATVSGD